MLPEVAFQSMSVRGMRIAATIVVHAAEMLLFRKGCFNGACGAAALTCDRRGGAALGVIRQAVRVAGTRFGEGMAVAGGIARCMGRTRAPEPPRPVAVPGSGPRPGEILARLTAAA